MELFDKLMNNPNAVGGVLMLVFLVWAYTTEHIIPGTTHVKAMAEKDVVIAQRDIQLAKMEKDRDEYKSMVLRALDITERTQRTAKLGVE